MLMIILSTLSFATKKLYVGTNAEFKPYEYLENNKMVGFDIELMELLGKELGYEILSSKKLEDKSEHKYQVNISRVDNAIYSHVNEIVWELVEIAESLDGYYDGWGCNITK